MKNIFLLLLLITIACGGKGPSAKIRIFLEDRDGFLAKDLSVIYLTYNTTKTEPKKDYNESTNIVNGKAEFGSLRRGNYTVTFKGDNGTDKCAVNLKLMNNTAERTIWLRSGQFTDLPD